MAARVSAMVVYFVSGNYARCRTGS